MATDLILAERIAALEAAVRELEHDLTALAEVAGAIFGEPFRSEAAAIVGRRQTQGG